MSLINNMLKDLEQREGTHAKVAYIPLPRPPKKRILLLKSLKIATVIIMFLSGALLLSNVIFKHKTIPLQPFINHPIQPSTQILKTIDTTWKNTSNITGITLQNKDNLTEVTFLLNRSALYRLDSDEMQNQLIIYVDRSVLKSEIPHLAYMNTAINNITAQQVKDDTRFTLSFAPGATLKYVNMNTVNGNPELVVAVRAATAIEQPSATTDQNVKSPAMQNVLAQQYQTALLNAETGHYQLAIQNLYALLKMDVEYKDARVSLAALLIDQDKIADAQKLIKQGLLQTPDFTPYIELKARIYALQGKYKLALHTLQNASPNLEENPEYHAFIAAMYERNNQFALAATLYKRLLANNANNSRWWFGLGVSLDKQGLQKDALDAYKRAGAMGHLSGESQTYLQTRLRQLHEAIDD